MISALAWVPKGIADPKPKRYEMSTTEQKLLELMEEKDGDLSQLEAELVSKLNSTKGIKLPKIENNLPDDLRMDEYSSDEEGDVADLLMGGGEDGDDFNIAGGAGTDGGEQEVDLDEDPQSSGDDEEEDNDEDDLADVPDTREFEPSNIEGLQSMSFAGTDGTGGEYAELNFDDDEDHSEAGDVALTDDDAILVVAKTEEDFASLEIHVYDQKTGNLFVHHDIPLPSYPLALAHGQVAEGGRTGNFCAVGTFAPGIEVWNLDVINAMEPTSILGGEDTSAAEDILRLQMLKAASGKQPKKLRKPLESGLRPGSHTDAVMSLSWNPIHRQVLASGSADTTVKLWDVSRGSNEQNERCDSSTFSHHRDKVQCLEWHPKEGTLLATGSFDGTVSLVDARNNDNAPKSIKVRSDCEAMAWDPFHSEYLTVLCEDGSMSCWDVRKFETSSPLWTCVVNEYGGVNNLAYNPTVPGMMATCSRDATVSLWDAYPQNNAPIADAPPRRCTTKDMCVGKLFALGFYPSAPWLLACGGSGNQLALWDLSSETAIQANFDSERKKLNTIHGVAPEPALKKDEDFEAMMKKDDRETIQNEDRSQNNKNKKKKGKGKKKVNKKGR